MSADDALFTDAVVANDVAEVQRRIDAGANIDAPDWDARTPLHNAVQHQHTALVELLLRHGANVNTQDTVSFDSPLHCACSRPSANLAIATMLLDAGAAVNARGAEGGDTPLHCAAYSDESQIVQLLLQRGADRTIESNDGDTAMSYAQGSRHVAVIELLSLCAAS
jgi:ankyrin repeat protein